MSDAAPVVLTLSPVLDLTAAEPLKAELLAHRGRVLVVDASGVERLGGLCLQVLLSALSLWRQDEINLRLAYPSDSFSEQWAAFGAPAFDSEGALA
ncbi:chemotaxis protein CheX [Brevundimonas nasdae]|jgi:chemotaxis protein CheX|uniref:STAS domain-containing protein n=1 Tax=Brevundimonas nasdae TaxID=172043 RepID=UPI00191321D3|nr:STAS domain-containing protein [Brevundimonas nasdae]MBK6023505.1 anti-sigma factor antagonist [Brevundimonas nasdae]MDQ0450155.1 chemotaxis protein CheX [Brevundimonas nasdae]